MSASTASLLLYFVFALGGAGVYFLMPKGGPQHRMVGAVLGLGAIAALLMVLATSVVSAEPGGGLFYLFAGITVIAAARVITHPRPVYSALYLVLVVVAVSALLILLRAEFVAIALIIIYAGAILVTYLFVIMLAQEHVSPIYDQRAREPFLAVLAGFVLMAAVAGRAGDLPAGPQNVAPVTLTTAAEPAAALPEGNTLAVGAVVMTRYLVALEIAGVLLLIAMVGAIALSKKIAPVDGHRAARAPIGQAGKEVLPF